ncbi:MAG: tetratricopeptide repeat protein [Muribaculaceae bacterium]|nr:tetratricopeptide repeat protein [Muribaculaceae bacterium]
MAGLLVLCLIGACGRGFDPRLAEADSKMEEHPDSAMMLLEGIELTPETSAADRAYYGLLLTHARYKNFIDETDDSLISVSADYFLTRGDKERASRALFLKGMIQMNANRLGEAAVSFRHGLDIAHESKNYMWEGQCARGLCMLYGELYDGSAQVSYAGQSYDAYLKTNEEDWIKYSKFVVSKAYVNNFKYEESLPVLDELRHDYSITQDTLMLSNVLELKGLALFGLGEYKEAIKCYTEACDLNESVLTDNDIANLEIALHEISTDSLINVDERYEYILRERDEPDDAFVVLASKGQYKDAYESLERYKNEQDSVLRNIFTNNVAESIRHYEAMRNALKEENIRNERMTYVIVILLCLIICVFSIWRFREHKHEKEAIRLKAEADMESLRSDLLSQLERVKATEADGKSTAFGNNENFERFIRQRYAEANSFCDDYYQGRFSKNEGNGMDEKIKNIVRDFTEKSSLDKIAEYVDEKSGGLYSSFKKDFFDITEEHHRLFLYLLLGFTSRTISVIIGQNISNVYNKKSRLKATIVKSDLPVKERYLKYF